MLRKTLFGSFIATPRAPSVADNLAEPSKGRLRRFSFLRDILHNAFRRYRKGPREKRSGPHLSNILIAVSLIHYLRMQANQLRTQCDPAVGSRFTGLTKNAAGMARAVRVYKTTVRFYSSFLVSYYFPLFFEPLSLSFGQDFMLMSPLRSEENTENFTLFP